jgi:hypothetical protein
MFETGFLFRYNKTILSLRGGTTKQPRRNAFMLCNFYTFSIRPV